MSYHRIITIANKFSWIYYFGENNEGLGFQLSVKRQMNK